MKNLISTFLRWPALALACLTATLPAGAQDLAGPTGSGTFGTATTTLPNGNFVVTDPGYDLGAILDVGAVHLYNGTTLALISTLTGSTVNNQVGSGGITVLTGSSNFVVASPVWDNGAATNAGAVTWVNGATGLSGVVSATNSLVGSAFSDLVGNNGITALANGNYVVRSNVWDNGATANVGAVTWGNGAGGTVGAVSAANSLVGTTGGDAVGNGGLTVLTNNNYVVRSSNWDNVAAAAMDAGAVTWGNGATGTVGAVSTANSLVGSTAIDLVGNAGVTVLTNGNYVVRSTFWDNGAATSAGAVTWGNGLGGTAGVVSNLNSLVGSATNDVVGNNGIIVLANGNYVVRSLSWNDNRGAVTWGNGLGGTVGAVSNLNSLVGTTANDFVGFNGITALANNNYVVSSPRWDNGAIANVGAATWGNGATGTVGAVSDLNSLVGSTANDSVGNSITNLANGNYVVASRRWDNGLTADVGAVTWGNGNGGTVGAVSAANSLVGTTTNDQVGSDGVTALANNNYVVRSQTWNGFRGAVTWGNGLGGTVGAVSAANSMVGSSANDRVGNGGVTTLTNNNYVVASPNWTGGPGAVTWGNGATAGPRTVGAVSAANSLVGSFANDGVGNGGITALANNNYVVRSSDWGSSAGAVTWGNGLGGTVGTVSAANSLVGSTNDDQLGSGGINPLANGNYVVRSFAWDNGTTANAGAVTWGNGAGGTVGAVSAANSLVGSTANDVVGFTGFIALANNNYVVRSENWDNGAVFDAGAYTYGLGTGGTVGPITAANSVRGTVAGGTNATFAIFSTGARILVGRPASNLATVFPYLLPTWDGTAWSPSTPNASDNAFVASGSPGSPPSFVANALTVQAGADLSLASGVTATVNGSLNYLGNVTVQSGGALLQTTGSTVGTTSGTFTAQRAVASKVGFGYNFISSPVAGQSIASVLAGNTFTNNRFRHDPTLASGARWIVFSGTMAAGTGYTHLPAAGTGTFNFVGIPNNGNVSTTLTGQAAYRFNVVGNPYPSPLRLSTLFTDNTGASGISGTAWFWQDSNNGTGTGNYLTLNAVSNPNAQVAVGQGFFVQANSNSGTLNFTNAQREAGNPTFYRGEASMERFRLAVSGTGGQDELWVAFGPQFTTGFEKGFDAEKLEGATTLSLSAIVNRERLAIAALPEPSSRFELPLQVFARGAGPCTFTATEVESPTAQKLFLEDRRSGEFYYLQPGRSHTLDLPAGNHRDRFYLRSASEIVGQSTQLGETAGAFAFGRELFVEAGETAEVAVYSTLGTLVQRFANVPPGGLRRLDAQVPSSGVYVVKVATATGSVEKRVWLEK